MSEYPQYPPQKRREVPWVIIILGAIAFLFMTGTVASFMMLSNVRSDLQDSEKAVEQVQDDLESAQESYDEESEKVDEVRSDLNRMTASNRKAVALVKDAKRCISNLFDAISSLTRRDPGGALAYLKGTTKECRRVIRFTPGSSNNNGIITL